MALYVWRNDENPTTNEITSKRIFTQYVFDVRSRFGRSFHSIRVFYEKIYIFWFWASSVAASGIAHWSFIRCEIEIARSEIAGHKKIGNFFYCSLFSRLCVHWNKKSEIAGGPMAYWFDGCRPNCAQKLRTCINLISGCRCFGPSRIGWLFLFMCIFVCQPILISIEKMQSTHVGWGVRCVKCVRRVYTRWLNADKRLKKCHCISWNRFSICELGK